MNELKQQTLHAAYEHLIIEFKLAVHKETDLDDMVIEGHLNNIQRLRNEQHLTWDSSIEKTVSLAIKCYRRELEKMLPKMDNLGKEKIQLELVNMKEIEKEYVLKESHVGNMMKMRNKLSLSSIKASIGFK